MSDTDNAANESPPKTFIMIEGQQYESSMAPKTDPERKFRDAWTKTGKVISVDMERAVQIQKDAIRAERAPLLADLDVELTRAEEIEDDAERAKARKAIIAKKNALRDVTKDKRLAAAKKPEDLAELTLEALLK